MNIEVIGSGCKKCKELYERTEKAVSNTGVIASVEYITNVQKILDMGLISSPVLAIDGNPVAVGILLDVSKIEELIKKEISK